MAFGKYSFVRFLLIIVSFLCIAPPATAQFASLNSDPLFRITLPPGNPYRQSGTVTYTIGEGASRALLRYKEVAIKVMQGEREILSVPTDRLPIRFKWDTTYVPDGRYQIRVVVTEKNGVEKIADYCRADVSNGPRLPEQPTLRTALPLPHPKWNAATIPSKLAGGETTLSITDWPSSVPDTMTPIVYVFKDGIMVNTLAAGPNPSGGDREFVINTSDWKSGTYRFVLMAADLETRREETCDEFVATLGGSGTKPATGLAPLPKREQWIPRNVPSNLPPYPTYEPGASNGEIEAVKKKRFEWVLAVARSVGDPHPEICAAQFAQESGWGEHMSGVNNMFGIKASPGEDATAKATTEWDGNGQYATTDYFKNYTSVYQCIVDRCQRFLKRPHYAKYWTARGSSAAIQALYDGGYCTDPDYVSAIMNIVDRQQRRVATR